MRVSLRESHANANSRRALFTYHPHHFAFRSLSLGVLVCGLDLSPICLPPPPPTPPPPIPPLCVLQESDYFTPQGEFRVDKAGSPTLLNCLMYKMSYYRFGEMQVSCRRHWQQPFGGREALHLQLPYLIQQAVLSNTPPQPHRYNLVLEYMQSICNAALGFRNPRSAGFYLC